MANLDDRPAVPPMDPGGDERIGRYATGGLFVVVGRGLGVVANLLAHLGAPAGGRALGPVVVYSTLGPFAWITLGIGAAVGLLGIGFFLIAREAPAGPVVLPGYPYPDPTNGPSGGTAEAAAP